MSEDISKCVPLHVFENGADPLKCAGCGLILHHSIHFHQFRAGYSRALCVCGYPPDSDNHILVVEDGEESRDRSRHAAVDLANREHDSNVILQFKSWISAHNGNTISITELGKVLDMYAFKIRQGPLK